MVVFNIIQNLFNMQLRMPPIFKKKNQNNLSTSVEDTNTHTKTIRHIYCQKDQKTNNCTQNRNPVKLKKEQYKHHHIIYNFF